MKTAKQAILAVILAAVWPSGLLKAQPKPAPPVPSVDVANQLKLKEKLLTAMGKTKLAESLAHVQQEWESLTPDQRRRFQQQALAFLGKSQEQQEELLVRYEKLIKMTAERREEYRQRANWLAAVVQWLEKNDPDRIAQLKGMRPADRAKELIALRDRLLKEKKITLDEPSTLPTDRSSAPTTRPAPEEGPRP